MPKQNLVSAVLSPEAKAEVLAKLQEIRDKLDFRLSLDAGDIQTIFKVGNSYIPFLDKAHAVVIDHPGIMPIVFDLDEFRNDYQLSKDLLVIVNQVNQLAESLQKTLMAVNSDAMNGALEIYKAVKQNKSRIPGLNVAAEELAVFFKRSRKKVPRTE